MIQPDEEFRPTFYLFLLGCGVVLSLALGIYIVILGTELFAAGIAFVGAAVMVAGALIGFGPQRGSRR